MGTQNTVLGLYVISLYLGSSTDPGYKVAIFDLEHDVEAIHSGVSPKYFLICFTRCTA